MSKVSVRVPASTANIGSGYDVFGVALSLYNNITIEYSNRFEICITGSKFHKSLPLDKNNLVYSSIKEYYGYINKKLPAVKISIDCNIPLSSGLGSSSTAIVGGLAAINKLEGDILNMDELIFLACKIEGHPDNTTPAIIGGFVISSVLTEDKVLYKKLIWPDEWKFIICHPDFMLSTQMARSVLPKEVPMKDAVFNIGCSSFLVAAICTKDVDLLRKSVNDKLHQPYRAGLVPGFVDIVNKMKNLGAIGTFLSGAGPSISIIYNSNISSEIINSVTTIWQKKNIKAEFFMPTVDNTGIVFS